MRRIAFAAVLLILGLTAVWSLSGSAVQASGPATSKGGEGASVIAISCAAPGECAAGGYYRSSRGGYEPLVISETNGSWGNAVEVPGIARLDHHHGARVTSISCAAPGECAAGGFYYYERSYWTRAFVVNETNGTWGNAVELPSSYGFTGARRALNAISCPAPGECVAVGLHDRRDFPVVSETTNGSWDVEIKLPRPAKLDPASWHYDTALTSISCAAPGECAAGGYFHYANSYRTGAFVVNESNGSWGTPIEVPVLASDDAGVTAISCAAAGECAAGGYYTTSPTSLSRRAFVVGETGGSWGIATPVPGTARFGPSVDVTSISCGAPGECAAGGYVAGRLDENHRPFVVSETDGKWGNAIGVPGMANPKEACETAHRCRVSGAEVTSISCSAAGDCAAGGAVSRDRPFPSYASVNYPTFVVSETDGHWSNAITVPGTATLNSISCAAPGECTAGGGYYWAWVVNETNGNWGPALRFK